MRKYSFYDFCYPRALFCYKIFSMLFIKLSNSHGSGASFNGADHRSCTGGARITKEGGSLKRDLRAGSVCMYVCMYVCSVQYCDVT